MPTVIDSIQIEIESSSSGASRGLDALTASLEKLKASGKTTTVVKRLQNLSAAVKGFSDSSGAVSSLNALAAAIERLKSVGSIASIANNLTKLPTALKNIESVDIGRVAPQLQGIADAARPLTEVKTGGLNSMVNALSKIDKVTKDLDDTKIAAFAERVKKLNETLGPLSEKMATIKTGFSAINTGANRASVSVKKFDHGIHTSTLNMSSFIEVARTAAQSMMGLVQQFVEFISAAIEWDGIKAQFGNAFGDQADEYYEKITRITDALRINKQAFMENSAMAASMLTGFGVNKEDAREMGLGYTELAYDIWAAYNNVYKTLDGADGAMAAVRSAIAGEVEPIRRAGFTIVESTLQQTAANHGLNISIEKATEAQKSYLRYLTLVDQAQSKGVIGTYAREMSTAEGMMRTFSQQLKSLAQAFGSLFLPVLTKVMPNFQAFIELLTDGVRAIAAFFGIKIQDIGSTWNDYSTGVDSAVEGTDAVTGALDDATKAAKELKNASIGIDELNVINPSTASAGGSGSGSGAGGSGGGFDGLDVESLWNESILNDVRDQVDALKEKILGFFKEWETEINIIGAALGALGMAKMLAHLGEALDLGNRFNGIMSNIAKLATTAIVITLQYSLMAEYFDSYIDSGQLKDYISALFVGAISTWVLYSMWGTGGLTIGLGVIAAASLSAIIENGGVNSTESVVVALTGLAAAIGTVVTGWKALSPVAKQVVTFFTDFASAVKMNSIEGGTLAAMFPKLSGGIASFGTAVSGAFTTVTTFLAGISAPVWAAIAAAIAAVVSVVVFLKENWDAVTAAAQRFFEENIAPKLEEIKNHFAKLKEAVSPISIEIESLVNWFKEAWERGEPLKKLGDIFEAIGGVIFAVVSGTIAGAINMFVGIVENAIQTFSGTVEIVSGVVELIVAVFNGGDIGAAWQKIWDGVVEVAKGLWGQLTQPITDVVDGVIGWFTNLWDELVGHSIVPDTIDGIVDSFTSLPGRVLGGVADFAGDVVDGFKNLGSGISGKFSTAWETVTTWWNKKTNLSAYTPTIGSVKDKLSSAWSSAKDWWKEKRGSLSTYTPSIGKIWENLKSAWTSAKDWWKDKRSNLSYTPSIGKISTKLSDAWTAAKNWWNKSRSSLSYTPSIGSIKDKVISAWNSAKTWWKNNVGGLSTKLNISVPKIKVQWDTVSAFGKSFRYPTGFKLEFAADGGIFDAGSLIWAGERGAEIVANAGGGKTGVMNVDQMQEAVYEGVLAAMTAVMGRQSGDGSQSVNVYLDSRQITSSVERRQREKGASILGNEVFA